MERRSSEWQPSTVYPKHKQIPCMFARGKRGHNCRGSHRSYVVCSMADLCLYCSVQHVYSDVHLNCLNSTREVTIGWKNGKIKRVGKRMQGEEIKQASVLQGK